MVNYFSFFNNADAMAQIFMKPAPSFLVTMFDIFASPSDAVQAIVGSAPSRSLWLIPMFSTFLIYACHTYIIFTDDSLKAEWLDTQINILHQKINEGKLTKGEAEAVETRIKSSSDITIVISIAGGAILIPLYFFGCALLLWLANKFILKSPAAYIKFLELLGIATWIKILGRIFTIVLMKIFDTIAATPSAVLFILESYDPNNLFHRTLMSLNIFTIWEIIVIGIGVGKISGRYSFTGLVVSISLWMIFVLFSVLFVGFAR